MPTERGVSARGPRRQVLRRALSALGLLLVFSLSAAGPASAASDREWTVMVYMNGKNNLEADALNNFHAMASVGSTREVAFVAQVGRPKDHYTTADGGWSGVYRFYVQKETRPVPDQSVASLAKLRETDDMGRPETLENFVRWSTAAYPAKRYMLIIWNHGQGYRLQLQGLPAGRSVAKSAIGAKSVKGVRPGNGLIGGFRAVSSDDDYGSLLYNAEVQGAVAHTFGKQKLDVLGFDACLMSMLETAYAFEANADVMVGSEELEPGDGWQYADWMSKLVAAPTSSPAAVGGFVVDAYARHYANQYETTLSTVRLEGTRAASRKLSGLADAVRKAGKTEMKVLLDARLTLASYADSDPHPPRTNVDLITLLKAYEARTQNVALRAQAAEVRGLAAALVQSNYASTRSQTPPAGKPFGSEGLAIYFPESKAAFERDPFRTGYLKSNTDRPVAFVQSETWADLLYATLGISAR